MAENKEKTVQKTYRLPVEQVAFIELLAKRQILGVNGSAVVRSLLTSAIRELIEKDYVKKYIETNELLTKR